MSDWWSRNLGGSSHSGGGYPPIRPRPVVVEPHPPAGTASTQYQSAPPAPSKAQHLKAASHCPECGSGNYMQQHGGRPRCFDCGYPVVQSTSGMVADSGVPTQAAQQVPTTYNPSAIEGHIA